MSELTARLKALRSHPEFKVLLDLIRHQANLAMAAEHSVPIDKPAAEFQAAVAFYRGQRLAWEAAVRLVDDTIKLEDEKPPA